MLFGTRLMAPSHYLEPMITKSQPLKNLNSNCNFMHHFRKKYSTYPHTSDIRRKFVGNKIADHSDVVGAAPVGAAHYIFILDLTPSFTRLHKDNCKTRQETFKSQDLMRLIVDVWRYIYIYFLYGHTGSNHKPISKNVVTTPQWSTIWQC